MSIIALVRPTTLVNDAMSQSVESEGAGDCFQSIWPAAAVRTAPRAVPTATTAPGNAESRTPANRIAERESCNPNVRIRSANGSPDPDGTGGADAQPTPAMVIMTANIQARSIMARTLG